MINALQEHHIGNWLKRGAWVIAAMGLIEIVLGIYSMIQQSGSPGNGPLSVIIVSTLQDVVSVASTALFYFLILYGAGALANYFAASAGAAVPEVEKERVSN